MRFPFLQQSYRFSANYFNNQIALLFLRSTAGTFNFINLKTLIVVYELKTNDISAVTMLNRREIVRCFKTGNEHLYIELKFPLNITTKTFHKLSLNFNNPGL